MKLSEIKAQLAELKAKLTGTSQVTAAELGEATGKLVALENTVTEHLEVALENLKQVQADLTTAKQSISTLTAEKAELTSKLEKAQNEANAANTQITNLKAEVETEKKRANDTLAKMGIDPDKIPGTPPGEGAAGKKQDFSQLKGLEKVIAIEKAEAAAKSNKK